MNEAGRELLLQAEESVREAQSAGWPNRMSPHRPGPRCASGRATS
jgi:hypothetical protein